MGRNTMNKRELSYKYLEGKTKYEFCPYCVKKCEEEGENWKEKLKPLKYVKTAEAIKQNDGSFVEYFDSHYECIRCGAANITAETFRMYYCARSDGTRYTEPPKEPGKVWSKEKRCLVPAKWNNVLQKWEEIIDKQA